jgi:anhydro-N-acetylmuramic acid kinase
MRCLGLMSGTSADGVDAVLVEFRGSSHQPRWSLLQHHFVPYPATLQEGIVRAGQGDPLPAEGWLDLAESLTEVQALAAKACDPKDSAALVGCHGQTVWHRPPSQERRGASWQLLQAPLLARLLNRPVVHDFRAADLALGGQGAPLVPRADAALLGGIEGWRGLLNLGGIANITLIPPRGGPDRDAPVRGWDCGPANSLIDLAVKRFSQGRLGFDQDGAMAAAGHCHEQTVQTWLQHPYLQAAPPKSTGRELFGGHDLDQRLRQLRGQSDTDVVATLTGFTAALVAQDLEHLQAREGISPVELVVAGGGRRNPALMQELRHRCLGLQLRSSDELGLAAEAREALVFALLAWWHLRRHPANAPAITGAQRETVLGVLVKPD